MSYEQTVEAHHKLTFTSNVKMVAQQLQNPLRNAVTVEPASGEAQDVADLIGKKEYQRSEENSRRNPDNPSSRSRRWLVFPEGIEDGEYLPKETKFKQAMDPTSALVRNNVKSVERGVGDRILGVARKADGTFGVSGSGILGLATEGKRPDQTVGLPSGNFIAHDFGGGGTGLSTEKLRGATEAMELEDFGLETDDEIYSMISPKQKTDLLNLALATKTNLNQFELEQIRTGKPTTLLGITWLFSNRLPVDENGYRLCPLWSKANIIAGIWQDVQGKMWNDTSAKNMPVIHVDAFVDCVRVEDVGVRVIRCEES